MIFQRPKQFLLSDIHWSVTCTVFGILGSFESLIAVLIFAPLCLPDSRMDKFYLVLIGILSFLAQIGLVLSAQFENAATVALIRKACDVIFAFIFQLVFFDVRILFCENGPLKLLQCIFLFSANSWTF